MSKLFIPGPTDVNPDVLKAQLQPMIGHRSQEFQDLYARIQPRLQRVFQTEARVYVAASSGSGLWEGAMRSLVRDRLLLCVCGAFGQRWADVAQGNRLAFDQLDVEWGEPNLPEQVVAALAEKQYDTLAVVHNETSTGVENPVREIVRAARDSQPELIVMVDAVSSAAGVQIPADDWGLDVVVTSSQKCFALPPGLALAAVSDRALERAAQVSHRGWYFDLLLLEKYHQRNYTPATPAISLLNALDFQLDRILSEGIEARQARHEQMTKLVQTWAQENFALFAAEGYRSRTVTAIRNTQEMNIPALNEHLAQYEMTLANGYGSLKNKTFRIGHMGETQPADVEELLNYIDEFLAQH
ncbi:MAG: alanine--glyoxylate aminotransferase family protein [Anaerolineae bacterium]|nr:MAG: alanine--glyoxylate aminotransferase family protein [Anaerolineae bacterium]